MTDSLERFTHQPVLLNAILEAFSVVGSGLFLDCTLGLGGHAEAILEKFSEASLIGIDRDLNAISLASQKLERFGHRFKAVNANFKSLIDILNRVNPQNHPVQAILVDLGVSSMQLDSAERGFSFQQEGPLDMRMDRSQPLTALELVNSLCREELANLIYEYGEEPASRQIARAIEKARQTKPIRTTLELASIVSKAVGGRYHRINPATKTFQALRIAVNDEIKGLDSFLQDAIELLHSGGRLAVISFHSLEDRIVKNRFRLKTGECKCPPNFPVCVCKAEKKIKLITKKPIVAEKDEEELNPRSRSAKLRICEKL